MKKVLFLLLTFMTLSCTKVVDSTVPNSPVYFTLDLRYEDKDLVGTYNYKTFTAIRNPGEAIGYAGLLVICGYDGSYYAYDLCCPYEASRTIRVEPNENGQAVCPQCKSVYDISNGIGQPVSGVSESVMKRYQVSSSGSQLVVRN